MYYYSYVRLYNHTHKYVLLTTTDINECEEDLSLCDENAACQNTLGNYNCTCFLGFMGNGTYCEGTLSL